MAMDWDKLRVFHAVAEAGSFTHAGESLNLSQSAVSRQISALEESLSVPLFHRHARGLILTEQGELLFRTAREVFAKLAMAENVRAALTLVARGEAALGIVYATDAAVEPHVKVLGVFPPDASPPIVYPVALTSGAQPQAAQYLSFLRSPASRAIFEAHGFAFLPR